MTNAEKDLMNYLRKLSVIESHLVTAMNESIGIYLTNPVSRNVPCLDDLTGRVNTIRQEVRDAQKMAQDRIDNPESPNV